MIFKFTVEDKGKIHECERIVTGKRIFRQTIRVNAIGSKEDPVAYGANRHPPASMGSVARLIAKEIIKQARDSG